MQLRPGDPFFTIPFVIEFAGPLDAALLGACLEQLIRRHAALRSTFVGGPDSQREVFGRPDDVDFGWLPGGVLDVGGDEAAAAAAVNAIARTPFDLAAGPPLRAQLIRLAADRHVLAVAVHHIVFDGWSLDIVLTELGALYRAAGAPESAFSGPAPDYVGYRQRSGETNNGPESDVDVQYWSTILAGAPQVIQLPSGQTRPVLTDHAAGRSTRCFSAEGVAPLRALAKSSRATMFMVLKAACDVALSHYGTADVVTGVALSGRDRAETHGLVGYLARPVMFRSDLRGDPSFRQLIAAVRDDLLDAHEHPELSFDAVARALDVPRDPSYNRFYQVMFGYFEQRPAHQLGDVRVTVTEHPPATMKVELSIVVTDTEAGLRLDLDYRQDLFTEVDLLRFADRVESVLTQVAQNPDSTVSQLRRLSAKEVRAAVDEPNRQRPASPPDDLRDLVDRALARDGVNPDAVAVAATATATERTYRDLAAAVDDVIRQLTAVGVRPGARVGLCARPSAEFAAAVLAVVRMGAAGVLLNPAWHPYALRNAQSESGFRVVLADPQAGSRFDRARVQVIEPRTAFAPSASLPAGTERGELEPLGGTDGTAFIAFQADDDVEQHAVVLSRELIATVLETLRGRNEMPHRVLPLAATTASLDAALVVLLALTAGGALAPGPDDGGVGGPAALREVYGPLEAGGLALIDGRPRPGLRAYLLGPDGEPVPPGAPGELFLGGPLIADGYLDDAATAARFRPDPLAGTTGGSAWKRFGTGQLGRLDPDGRFRLLGAARAPLIRAGHRVDLGPIDDALTRHPGVDGARVLVRDRPDGEREVLALVTRRPFDGEPVNAGTLATQLAARLPGYLQPDRILVVDALPPHGKLDAERIHDILAEAELAAVVGPVDPRTAARGELIRSAWEKVLGRVVAVDLNFFEAGGDSLLLIRLRNELQSTMGGDIALTDLFSHPTIRAMTERFGRPAVSSSAADRGAARRQSYARRGS